MRTQPLKSGEISENIYTSQNELSMTAGQTKTYTVFFSSAPCEGLSSSLQPGLAGAATATITAATYYPWGADITVNCIAAGIIKVLVEGYKYVVSGEEIVTSENAASQLEFGVQRYEIPVNHLVQNLTIAKVATDFILASYRQAYKDVSLDWRGDPSLLLSDVAQAPEYVKGAINRRASFWIYRQNFSFDGTLRATLDGRKIPGTEIDDIQDTYGAGEGTWQNTFDAGDPVIQNTL
jgi:hypothetical protein